LWPLNQQGLGQDDREVSSSESKSDGGDELANEEELPRIKDIPCNKSSGCKPLKEVINILFLKT
jgi:hypothetical protein